MGFLGIKTGRNEKHIFCFAAGTKPLIRGTTTPKTLEAY
jgi:hypothetical protein